MYAIGGNNSYGSKCYRTNLTTIFTHIERTSPTIKYFATEHSSHKCSNFPHFANQPNKTKITIIDDEVFTVGPTLPHPIRRCVSEINRLCHKINTLYQIYFCIQHCCIYIFFVNQEIVFHISDRGKSWSFLGSSQNKSDEVICGLQTEENHGWTTNEVQS